MYEYGASRMYEYVTQTAEQVLRMYEYAITYVYV